jgi:hypothetical protein
VGAARAARLWTLYDPALEARGGPGEGRPEWAMWIGITQLWLLLPCAALGVAVVHGRRRWLLLTLPVVATVAGVFVAAYWRVRIPADVSVVVLAAAGVDRLVFHGVRRPALQSETAEFGPSLVNLPGGENRFSSALDRRGQREVQEG